MIGAILGFSYTDDQMTNPTYDFPIFLINLDGSDDRLASACNALRAQGAHFIRIPAFDGREIETSTITEYDNEACMGYLGRPMNGGEIGCYISHVRAAQAFLETGQEYGLVLEDDMMPNPDALALTQMFIDHQKNKTAPDWYVAHLSANKIKIATKVGTIEMPNAKYDVVRAHYFPMVATALLWNRAGAERFLEGCWPISAPVDNHFRRWLTAIDKGVAIDPQVFKASGAPSDIDAKVKNVPRNENPRSRSYGVKKIKRMYGDKLRALAWKLAENIKRLRSRT